MPSRDRDEDLIRALFAAGETAPDLAAPSTLKSRVYSALVRAQQESGPLCSLEATRAAGRDLCVFERIIQIAPLGDGAKSPFFCAACHARILAERVEDPPIFWPHCPYVAFKKR